jgi:hypothetical protein
VLGCAEAHLPSGADAGAREDPAADGVDAGPARVDAGAAFTVPGAQSAPFVRCEDDGMTFFVEIWPVAISACVPPAEVHHDLLLVGIQRWDGSAGTFELGEETPRGRASGGTGLDELRGAITIEPFDDVPRVLAWDLDGAGEGRLDLSVCGRFERYPCPTP